jgi:hypothetical protein
MWSTLLNATDGALMPEKCFWYTLDYECKDREWTYTEMAPKEMFITNPDGTKSLIVQEEVNVSKKTPSVHGSPAAGNAEHLTYIKEKVTTWVNRMTNGHLPHHMAWTAYKHQLWPGLRYSIGSMTNDLEVAEQLLNKVDYKTLNLLGVVRTATKGLRKIHTTFGGFGLHSLATEQLISRVNAFLQHYHMPAKISKKLDTSLHYLQLQLGMPHNLLTLDYGKWGHLAHLSWVKMFGRSLQQLNFHLHMNHPSIPHRTKGTKY